MTNTDTMPTLSQMRNSAAAAVAARRQAGSDAFAAGQPYDTNPHPLPGGSSIAPWYDWHSGWQVAYADRYPDEARG